MTKNETGKSSKAFVENLTLTEELAEKAFNPKYVEWLARQLIREIDHLYPFMTDKNNWGQWDDLKNYLDDFLAEYEIHFGVEKNEV